MAIYHEDFVDINLNTGTVHRTFSQMNISEGDAAANMYGFRLWDNEYPISLTGATCEKKKL